MIFEALNKLKMCEYKKGKKEIHPSQNWKNLDMETSCTISVFCHNFLHRCLVNLILVAMERRLEDLQLCSLPQIPEKSF